MQDLATLLTPETLVIIIGLFTPFLTNVFKKIFKSEGNATLMANVVINAVTKGVLLFMADGRLLYAIGFTVIGIVSDKVTHSVITGQSK